ncbi:hypothetical protein D3C72_1838390 [compost metagenome]
MSNVSGAWAPMVGCRAEGGFQALYRTPATNSPVVPVVCSGSGWPLTVTTWRLSFMPVTRTSMRSSDEST